MIPAALAFALCLAGMLGGVAMAMIAAGRGHRVRALVLGLVAIASLAALIITSMVIAGDYPGAPASHPKSLEPTIDDLAAHGEKAQADEILLVPGRAPVFYRDGYGRELTTKGRSEYLGMHHNRTIPRFLPVSSKELTALGIPDGACRVYPTGGRQFVRLCPGIGGGMTILLYLKPQVPADQINNPAWKAPPVVGHRH